MKTINYIKLPFLFLGFLSLSGILGIPATTYGQVVYEKLQTTTLPVRQVAGHSLSHYAWTTDQAVYIMYDGTLYTHTSLEYTAFGVYHNPPISAVEDLMITGYGRLFLRTSDGYTLAFDEGMYVGGINLESYDFSPGRDINVESFALMEIQGDLLPVRHTTTLWNVQFQIYQFDDNLVSQFQDLQPNLYGAFLGYHVFVNGDTPAIGVGYESGHKLKVHTAGSSHFPCAGFTDVVTRGRVNFVGFQNFFAVISLACADGRLAIVKRQLNNNSSLSTDFQPQEWRVVDFPGMGHGQVLQIEAPMPFTTTTGDVKDFVFGRTDQAGQGLFVINTRKETHCLLDTPGNLPVSDFYVDNPDRLFLSTGQSVYSADISQVQCAISTSTEDYATSKRPLFQVLANPSRQVLDVLFRTEEVAGGSELQLISMDGRICPVNFRGQGLERSANIDFLPPGLYFLQMIFESEIQTIKVILLP